VPKSTGIRQWPFGHLAEIASGTGGGNLGLKWADRGAAVCYLGFPIGFQMPTEETGNKVILQITSQLVKWGAKKLSLAGRILAINQVILASIWFVFLCATVTQKVFSRVKALVRNFLWTGTITSRARAKVSWDTAIRPLSQGGIKIFDPKTQARALLDKLVTRGLAPGGDPWKLVIRHRLSDTQLQHYISWPHSAHWLIGTKLPTV
jgi:hypothetical protein